MNDQERKLLLAEYLTETLKHVGENLLDVVVKVVEDLQEMGILKDKVSK